MSLVPMDYAGQKHAQITSRRNSLCDNTELPARIYENVVNKGYAPILYVDGFIPTFNIDICRGRNFQFELN